MERVGVADGEGRSCIWRRLEWKIERVRVRARVGVANGESGSCTWRGLEL